MRNYKIILLFTLFTLLLAMPHEGQAQKWKEAFQKAKDKLGEKAKDFKGGLLEGGKELLEARKAAMDTATTYNYAISMSDNAGLYSENSQMGKLALNSGGSCRGANYEPVEGER